MSRIYLPDGGQIEIYNGWTSTTDPSGHVDYYSHDKKYLGSITVAGIVHLSNNVSKTYFPPNIKTVDEAFRIIKERHKDLSQWQAKQLKSLLGDFDARSGFWKK